jgi:hypothetical protein
MSDHKTLECECAACGVFALCDSFFFVPKSAAGEPNIDASALVFLCATCAASPDAPPIKLGVNLAVAVKISK